MLTNAEPHLCNCGFVDLPGRGLVIVRVGSLWYYELDFNVLSADFLNNFKIGGNTYKNASFSDKCTIAKCTIPGKEEAKTEKKEFFYTHECTSLLYEGFKEAVAKFLKSICNYLDPRNFGNFSK